MGTRGLTIVIKDGAHRIAQYGQWDHYPSGQGLTALRFCREWLPTPDKVRQFATQLDKCKFVSREEISAAEQAAKWQVGSTFGEGMMCMDSVRAFQERFPLIDRNIGAEILALVATGVKKGRESVFEGSTPDTAVERFELMDELPFAGDSLFCEYAYLVDLDLGVLEVYKGFNQTPVSPENRFAQFKIHERYGKKYEYEPVALAGRWSLDKLPTEDEFLSALKSKEE